MQVLTWLIITHGSICKHFYPFLSKLSLTTLLEGYLADGRHESKTGRLVCDNAKIGIVKLRRQRSPLEVGIVTDSDVESWWRLVGEICSLNGTRKEGASALSSSRVNRI